MTTFRHALASAAALALATGACTLPAEDSGPALGEDPIRQPLIGGTVTTEIPAAAALNSSANTTFCTATLVSPSVLLTAAHCIDMAAGDPNIIAYFGDDVNGEGVRVGIGKKAQHPMWTGDVGMYDVGMLKLNFAQDPLLPMKINNVSPAVDHEGDPYLHVGFGVYDRDSGASDGKKRQGMTTINGFQNDVILSGDDEVSVCFGDSGGPGILEIDGEPHVAGIHSYTSSQDCFPPNGDTRVDLYADDFILPWIQENDPVCGMDGTCAPIGCTDDPDCTPCGANGECTDGCALPDPDCPTSEIGEICQADTQCTTETCVFWEDDTSYEFCTRECDPGADDCPDGMSCQERPGFGNVCYYDETPPGVLGDPCEEATDCGSYLCEEGMCIKPCDLSAGQRKQIF